MRRKRIIYMSGVPHVVHENATPRDIRKSTNIDRDRFLAIQNPDKEGYEIFDEKKQLPKKRDLNLISLPRYRQGFDYKRERILKEVSLISSRFPVEIDEENLKYIAVLEFPLNEYFSQSTTTLLIKIPEDYPYTPPIHFFMKKSLTYKDRNPGHYFKDIGFNELGKHGWGKFCLHIRGKWMPSDNNNILDGDNLISYLELIKVVLDNIEREKV